MSFRLLPNVAPGVHLLTGASVNCYLVEDAGRLTLVDAGLPRMWPELQKALRYLGHTPDAMGAVLLTHGHFDHVGMLPRLQRNHAVPVWVHTDDAWLARHPYRYRPARNRIWFSLTHPGSLPHVGAMAAAGALWVRGATGTATIDGAEFIDAPGRPGVIPTPGHTHGHSAFVLDDRGVIFTGDALVTLDPYTGHTGPRIVARAGTEHPDRARLSLDAIADSGAHVLLPGHGRPWRGDVADAAAQAEEAGSA